MLFKKTGSQGNWLFYNTPIFNIDLRQSKVWTADTGKAKSYLVSSLFTSLPLL